MILSLVALVFFSYTNGSKASEILILLTLYLTVTIRLLPSATRIMGSIQSLFFFSEVIERLHKSYSQKSLSSNVSSYKLNKDLRENYIIFDSVSFSYNEKEPLFKELNIKFKKK